MTILHAIGPAHLYPLQTAQETGKNQKPRNLSAKFQGVTELMTATAATAAEEAAAKAILTSGGKSESTSIIRLHVTFSFNFGRDMVILDETAAFQRLFSSLIWRVCVGLATTSPRGTEEHHTQCCGCKQP